MLPKISSEHGGQPDKNGMTKVFTRFTILNPGEVCTQSYLISSPFFSFEEVKSFESYLKTKFARFLILQSLSSMNISKESFRFVPKLNYNFIYTDDYLYKLFELSTEEISQIESLIREME
jgi:site-specific DNA-methyltransferase (adenine-specific)